MFSLLINSGIETDELSSRFPLRRLGRWSWIGDAASTAKEGYSAYDAYDEYNDNDDDGLGGLYILMIVIPILTILCTLYQCMGGGCDCGSSHYNGEMDAGATGTNSDDTPTGTNGTPTFGEAVQQASKQVKEQADEDVENGSAIFDSYEGDFEGWLLVKQGRLFQCCVKVKLKDNGIGYDIEGTGISTRGTEIRQGTVHYSGHAFWVECGPDRRGRAGGSQRLTIGKFDFENNTFDGTWLGNWGECGSFETLTGNNIKKALKSDEGTTKTQESDISDVSSITIKDIKDELHSYSVDTSLFLENDEMVKALHKAREESYVKNEFPASHEAIAKEEDEVSCHDLKDEDDQGEFNRSSFDAAIATARYSVGRDSTTGSDSTALEKYQSDIDLVYHGPNQRPGHGTIMFIDCGEGLYKIEGTFVCVDSTADIVDGVVSHLGSSWFLTKEETTGAMVLYEGLFDFTSSTFEGKWVNDMGDRGGLKFKEKNPSGSELPAAAIKPVCSDEISPQTKVRSSPEDAIFAAMDQFDGAITVETQAEEGKIKKTSSKHDKGHKKKKKKGKVTDEKI